MKQLLAVLVVFFWTTADGGIAFTDDPKKVPLKYRADVKSRVVEGGLDAYPKLTTGKVVAR